MLVTARAPLTKDGKLSPEDRREMRRGYRAARERMVQMARWNIRAFIEYVMRHEITGARITVEPFQEEWHWLADKYDRLMILAFMESGKSFQLSVARTLWELGRDPTLQFAIVSRTKAQAKKVALLLAQYIESSEELHEVFPHLKPHPDPRMPWNSEALTIARNNRSKEPSIQIVSVGKAIQGARLNRVILDDVLDRENTRTPTRREDTWDWYIKQIPGRLTEDGRILGVGNAFHREDLYHRLARNDRWKAYRFPIVWPNGQLTWPRVWHAARVEGRKVELGPINWKIQMLCEPVDMPLAGMFFRRNEIEIIDFVSAERSVTVRRWDLAATEPHEGNWDPDWTAGVKMSRTPAGKFIVEHVEMVRKRAAAVRELILRTARNDGEGCMVGLAQDPGQAGVDQAESYVTDLAGFNIWTDRETGDKVTRAEPFAAQWQHHNVILLRGSWNEKYLDFMEAFPTLGVHDDVVDASVGAFRKCLGEEDIFAYYKR